VLWERLFKRPSQQLLETFSSLSLLLMPSCVTSKSSEREERCISGNDPVAPSLGKVQPRHNTIEENLQLIQSVLDFWFGQYPPDVSQKMLWMIAASSELHRQKVDQEIAQQFKGILLELVSPFSPRWNELVLDPHKLYGSRGKIAAIVVLDQFSRHILRFGFSNNRPLPIVQSMFDQLALKTSELLMEHHSKEIECGMIPMPMYIFALMPYRHANSIKAVQYVQDCIGLAAGQHTHMETMLGRFRKATNRRMALLQDEERRTGTSQGETSPLTLDSSSSNHKCDAKTSLPRFRDEDLLETFPFEADLTPVASHPVHKTIVQFLANQGILPATTSTTDSTSEDRYRTAVVISLSGGVDSMVIASVLAHLKKSCGYHHMEIFAVHIDYANRPESGAEAAIVQRYCSKDYLDIKFQCRRIDEVTRGITARDDYERIARNIRYTTYRETVAEAKKLLPDNIDCVVGVMLGHHRGDLRENVLSNAHKGCGPLDLSGMTTVSLNDGIVVYRPLLSLEKSSILDYAHKFGVPYFKDTTPRWSTRGKLRNRLIPLLEEIYGDGSMNNLSDLAVESDECRALVQKSIIGPFMEAIVRRPMGIILDTAPWKEEPVFFWKFVLREALHSASFGMFSEKSVNEFMKRLKAKKVKNAWLQCRRDYGVYLQEDGKVFVFHPRSFPWNKKDPFGVDGQGTFARTIPSMRSYYSQLSFLRHSAVVDVGTDTMVGPWKIRSEIFKSSSFHDDEMENPTAFLSKRAVSSMEGFMDGKMEYFIEAPIWTDTETGFSFLKPLVFCQCSKDNRPPGWKNSDLRIQATLPLLCNNDFSRHEESSGKDQGNQTTLVRVSLELVE
jgi:tRNA(Ile)-lysidine synthetase-like protein